MQTILCPLRSNYCNNQQYAPKHTQFLQKSIVNTTIYTEILSGCVEVDIKDMLTGTQMHPVSEFNLLPEHVTSTLNLGVYRKHNSVKVHLHSICEIRIWNYKFVIMCLSKRSNLAGNNLPSWAGWKFFTENKAINIFKDVTITGVFQYSYSDVHLKQSFTISNYNPFKFEIFRKNF